MVEVEDGEVTVNEQVKIFSRNCEDCTASFPDVVETMQVIVPWVAVP